MQYGVINLYSYLLLRFDHHSAGGKCFWTARKRPPYVIRPLRSEVDPVTCVVPPTAAIRPGTVVAWVVVVVVCREHHPIMIEGAAALQAVPSVSAVAVHVDTILVVRLVADRKRPVLR